MWDATCKLAENVLLRPGLHNGVAHERNILRSAKN